MRAPITSRANRVTMAAIFVFLGAAFGCIGRENRDSIESLDHGQKVRLAAEILRELRPVGYCTAMPPLSDVVAGRNSRVTISLDEPELGYPDAAHGTVVGFSYVCSDDDAREHISEHLVNLRTREVTVHQIDDEGFAPGRYRLDEAQSQER